MTNQEGGKLLELAAICESVVVPDRTLDAMIHWQILNGVGTGYAQDAPNYTTSLDTAMTLVPEDRRIAAFFEDAADEAWKVNLGLREGRFGRRGEQAYGATPALALAAACLRARAHTQEATHVG